MKFLSNLGLIFITLKLLGKIDWAWWLVLLPILLQIGLINIVGGKGVEK